MHGFFCPDAKDMHSLLILFLESVSMKTKQKRMGVQYNRALVSVVLIGLMSIPPYASAEESEYLATEYLDYGGRHVAEINFLRKH